MNKLTLFLSTLLFTPAVYAAEGRYPIFGPTLRKSEEGYRRMLDTAQEGIWVLDTGRKTIYVNQCLTDMLGFTPLEMNGADFVDFVEESARGEASTFFEQCKKGKKEQRDFRFFTKGGADLWTIVSASPIFDENGSFRDMLIMITDVTQRKKVERELRESNERYALAALGANDGLWDWNLKTNQVYFSPRWKSMLGFEEDQIGNSPDEWFSRVHSDDLNKLHEDRRAHLAGLTPHFQNEHRMRHQDGSYRWILARGIGVRDEDGMPTRMAGSLTDVTDRRRAEEQLLHEAIHDGLTGISNRAFFMDLLRHSIGRAKRHPDYLFAVLFLDLDRFKVINDSFGHLIGDQLLKALARRLQDCLRPGDNVARFGGDEFTILTDHIKELDNAVRVAERIQREMAKPFHISGEEIFTSSSIGITVSSPQYTEPEEMIRDADTAMYRAKSLGRSQHQVFDVEMHNCAVALMKLETDLRRAIERQDG